MHTQNYNGCYILAVEGFFNCYFPIEYSGQIDGQEIVVKEVLAPKPNTRRFSPFRPRERGGFGPRSGFADRRRGWSPQRGGFGGRRGFSPRRSPFRGGPRGRSRSPPPRRGRSPPRRIGI